MDFLNVVSPFLWGDVWVRDKNCVRCLYLHACVYYHKYMRACERKGCFCVALSSPYVVDSLSLYTAMTTFISFHRCFCVRFASFSHLILTFVASNGLAFA